MECERLNRLVRSWYDQVQGESLAPARMVEFMEKHVENCDDCLADPDVRGEVKKITELVLPPSKMTKPVKSAKPRDAVPVEVAAEAEVEAEAEADPDDVENGDEEDVDSDDYEETTDDLVPEPE